MEGSNWTPPVTAGLNFSMIRRDITGTSFLYESPRAIQWESPDQAPEAWWKGGQLPLMQIIAGWCFCDKVFILLSSSACSRMLRTICPSSWTHLARAKFGVQPEDFFDLVDLLLCHWAESYHQPSGSRVDGSRWIEQGYSQRISVPKHSLRNHGEIPINTPFLTFKTD